VNAAYDIVLTARCTLSPRRHALGEVRASDCVWLANVQQQMRLDRAAAARAARGACAAMVPLTVYTAAVQSVAHSLNCHARALLRMASGLAPSTAATDWMEDAPQGSTK
jgi:hypothetical protein